MLKPQQQSSPGPRFTIFKPPRYIYKLFRLTSKIQSKTEYLTYFNQDYSLRKYHRTLPVNSQAELVDYEWRKHTACPVVSVVYLELLNKTISKANSEAGVIEVNVYTEQLQKLLADMIDLTLSEAIYVLKQCVCAYRQLFTRFSAVSISKFYSGINAQGKLKVWINDNFALNCNAQASSLPQQPYNEVLITQTAIVNKIVHMVGQLASPSCKFFFYGLTQELTVKRFSFNNCLQFINSIVANTKSLVIPNDLSYMLPKPNTFGLDRSNVKFMSNPKFPSFKDQRRGSFLSPPSNTNSYKQFVPFSQHSYKKSAQKQSQHSKKPDQVSQKKFRFKRYSQQLPNNFNFFHNRFPSSKIDQKPTNDEKMVQSKKQCPISLHVIAEKGRRNSVNGKEAYQIHKSNISLQNQRPSISAVPVPAFISKSVRGQKGQEDGKNNGQNADKSQKSFSIQSNKQKEYDSLVNSKIGSVPVNTFGSGSRYETLFRTLKTNKPEKLQTQDADSVRRSEPANGIRARSASANFKFGYTETYLVPERFPYLKSEQANLNIHQETTTRSHNEKGDKMSTNSISNQGNAKRRSFLTRTNYDSSHDQNQKNQSFCRMDFSSMSIDNKITNKNLNSDVCQSRKEDMKRSLMSYKFGFQQILENPSCKQVEQENQTKSYNGSSLRNTQNITEQLAKLQKKNEETVSNNFSFGNSSKKLIRRNMKDSVEENWDMIKQKNEEFLVKNQWKKTINNLGELEQMPVNESIIDASNEIIRRDKYADVRLEKLERLGRNMCFSIVKRTEDGTFTLNSSLKRSEGM